LGDAQELHREGTMAEVAERNIRQCQKVQYYQWSPVEMTGIHKPDMVVFYRI
jgi:hypothetical protein